MARSKAAFASGHKKANPLEVNVPAPSGGKFIPESDRGPRPELPHMEYSAYEEAATDLTPQQVQENNHIKIQQKNWDAHKDLEDNAALEAAKKKKATPTNFNAVDESQLSEDEKRILSGGLSISTSGERLSSLHGALSGVANDLKYHADRTHAVVSKIRAASTNALNKMNELSIKHASQHAKSQPVDPDEVDRVETLRSFVSNATTFPQRHIAAMNRVTTAQNMLQKANSLIKANNTPDAVDIMVRAHGELKRIAKHLNNPLTKMAYEHAGIAHQPVDTPALDGASANLQQLIDQPGGGEGRKRGPQTEAPTIKIGKKGRLPGDKGSEEHVVADESGLNYVTKKYGTVHPYTQRVRREHIKWKRGKPSNKPISQIMAEPAVKPAEQKQRVQETKTKEQAVMDSPEQIAQRKSDFKAHSLAVIGALKAGRPIPGESADHIGPENVKKLIQRHLSEKGEI